MRMNTKTAGALAALAVLTAGQASAEIEGEIHVGYHNMYEFRFVDLGSDLVETGVNLSLGSAGGFNFSAGAWYASTNDSKTGSFNELDLTAAVGYEAGPVSLEAGYIFYHFLDVDGADTQEVFLSASYNVGWDVNVGATFYYDFDSNNGWYLQPEVTKSFAFNDCLSLDVAAGIGIANGQDLQVARYGFGTADGFQGWFLSASLPWKIRENITLTPYVKYTDGDSDLITNLTDVTSGQDYLVAGVTFGVSF